MAIHFKPPHKAPRGKRWVKYGMDIDGKKPVWGLVDAAPRRETIPPQEVQPIPAPKEREVSNWMRDWEIKNGK